MTATELGLAEAHLAQARLLLRRRDLVGFYAFCNTLLQQQQLTKSLLLLIFHVCSQHGATDKQIDYAQTALTLFPDWLEATLALSQAHRTLQQHANAIKVLEHALINQPEVSKLWQLLGILNKEMGELSSAVTAFNQAILHDPNDYENYWLRADLLKQPNKTDIAQLAALTEQPDLTKRELAFVCYALARAYEFNGQYALSFQALQRGAKAKRQTLAYNHQAELAEFVRITEVFQTQHYPEPEKQAITPIFICGLPRSGTTLVEHILSSHPLITAGDELFELARATEQQLSAQQRLQPFPLWINSMQPTQWQDIGKAYLAQTRYVQHTPYFTDKMPLNLKAIGIIAKALPQAKIIYCERHPLDMLFSCYKQLFAEGIGFSYDLSELASIYRAQHKLMQFWQAQLPGRIFSIKYENLVKQQHQETDKLLTYLGLSWAEQCIDFHLNPRAVYTVSSTQVRQPLFSQSVGSWQHYKGELVELRQLLAEEIRAYEAALC